MVPSLFNRISHVLFLYAWFITLQVPVWATDYDEELTRLEQALKQTTELDTSSPIASLRRFYLQYSRATLTGNTAELVAIEQQVADTMKANATAQAPVDDQLLAPLVSLHVRILLKLHRLEEATALLKRNVLAEQSELDAELALQQDDLKAAQQKLEKVNQARASWENQARLAHLQAVLGKHEVADRLYILAQDQLTAKEMRYFAWLELQRGRMDFMRGDLDAAEAHYRLAIDSYSGYWMIEESMAELLAARNKNEEAIAGYRQVLTKCPRPETKLALGLVMKAAGQHAESKTWLDQAHRDFLSSAKSGQTHYLHHLVDYYTEVELDGSRALPWAEADYQLRPNPATRQSLAWCHFMCGDSEQALALIEPLMALGIHDAHLYQRAARICASLGEKQRAAHLRQRALDICPTPYAFHIHY